jgi:hypothetical protein
MMHGGRPGTGRPHKPSLGRCSLEEPVGKASARPKNMAVPAFGVDHAARRRCRASAWAAGRCRSAERRTRPHSGGRYLVAGPQKRFMKLSKRRRGWEAAPPRGPGPSCSKLCPMYHDSHRSAPATSPPFAAQKPVIAVEPGNASRAEGRGIMKAGPRTIHG